MPKTYYKEWQIMLGLHSGVGDTTRALVYK